jgi:hypothetical protein
MITIQMRYPTMFFKTCYFSLLVVISVGVVACASVPITPSAVPPADQPTAPSYVATVTEPPTLTLSGDVSVTVPVPSPTFSPVPNPTPSSEATMTAIAEELADEAAMSIGYPDHPLPLSAFPRPGNDNGLGIHWSTHLYAQSDEATSYFVSELTRMNIKWVKILVDGLNNRDYDRTIDELVSRDIMPVIRIYRQCNTPYDPEDLRNMVEHYVAKGVYYFETYNEPNQTGEAGGWCQAGGEPQPEYLAQIWADAARVIYQAGGYPGLPSFFAPDQKLTDWRNSFFYRFFQALQEQDNVETLYFSWGAIHNYTINHPPTYPFDPVNQTGQLLTQAEAERYQLSAEQVTLINLQREVAGILKRRLLNEDDAARLGLSLEQINEINAGFQTGKMHGFTLDDDSTAFLHFISYRNQFYRLFGFEIPLISTEGGATRGSGEDPRYPVVDGRTVADWTVWSAGYMLDNAPDYYFATNTWLLAQHALDYDEPVWEINAWYHDRDGDQEPVVDALKTWDRHGEPRSLCFEMELRAAAPRGHKAEALCRTADPQPDRNPLGNYPRPPQDNGRGVHWSPGNQPQPPQVTDYFVHELQQMNIKWVKFLQDDLPYVSDPYLVEQLVANGIEPVMRVYKPRNEPYQHLPELVATALDQGVHYFELYNEPNVTGPAGGWETDEPPDVDQIVDLWILAATDVHRAGGHPGLPSLAPGGTIDDMLFLRQFLDGIRARGQEQLLPGSWLPVHNYFLNHPLEYPTDVVNVHDVLLTPAEIEARALTTAQVEAINTARKNAKLPFEQGGFWVGNDINEDSNAFGKFEAYANIFYDRFGYYLPVIGTEGGAISGSAEDPRYPPLRDEDVTAMTMATYHYMLDQAPPYFFAHTAWLIANGALGSADPRFEHAAWYKDRQGTVLPVVEALKQDSRLNEVRTRSE